MKIVATANAHALAHVSRLLEVAKVLRQRGHEVLFAGHGKYLGIVEWDGFLTRELPYIPVDQVVRAVRSQRLWELFPEQQLRGFLAAEVALYEEIKPDLVLIDNRPTARTSAERLGIKTAAVLNVHMSNHKRIPFFSLSNLIGTERDLAPLRQLDTIENFLECLMYDRLVMGRLNALRREMSLPRLRAYEHEQGGLTFFADVPEFSPVRRLPLGAQYIGPLTWHNDLPPPPCIDQLSRDKRTIYLSLGSEGLEDLLPHLDLLAREGVQVVVATGAAATASMGSVPEGVFLEQYVNTDKLLPHCDLVCCHGGNGTLYQALSFGLPVVVVATHQEQSCGGKRIQRLGLGRTMMLKEVRKRGFETVLAAVRGVLADPGYRQRAQRFAHLLHDWNGANLAADAIENFVQLR